MEIVVVDTDPKSIKVLEACFAERVDVSSIRTFRNAQDALAHIAGNDTGLVFINVDILESIPTLFVKNLPPNTACVFISESTQYAAEAFEIGVYDYMVKPLAMDRCHKSLMKFKPSQIASNKNPKEILFVKVNHQILKLRYDEIYFIEADGDYVEINTAKNKYVINMGMKVIEETLKDKPFVRIHRSFIVAIDKIDKIVNNKVIMKTIKLPIGNAYKNEFMAMLNVLY